MMRRWRRIRRKNLVFERGSVAVRGGWQSGALDIGMRGVVTSSVRVVAVVGVSDCAEVQDCRISIVTCVAQIRCQILLRGSNMNSDHGHSPPAPHLSRLRYDFSSSRRRWSPGTLPRLVSQSLPGAISGLGRSSRWRLTKSANSQPMKSIRLLPWDRGRRQTQQSDPLSPSSFPHWQIPLYQL